MQRRRIRRGTWFIIRNKLFHNQPSHFLPQLTMHIRLPDFVFPLQVFPEDFIFPPQRRSDILDPGN
jgi:hypothetical protein